MWIKFDYLEKLSKNTQVMALCSGGCVDFLRTWIQCLRHIGRLQNVKSLHVWWIRAQHSRVAVFFIFVGLVFVASASPCKLNHYEIFWVYNILCVCRMSPSYRKLPVLEYLCKLTEELRYVCGQRLFYSCSNGALFHSHRITKDVYTSLLSSRGVLTELFNSLVCFKWSEKRGLWLKY